MTPVLFGQAIVMSMLTLLFSLVSIHGHDHQIALTEVIGATKYVLLHQDEISESNHHGHASAGDEHSHDSESDDHAPYGAENSPVDHQLALPEVSSQVCPNAIDLSTLSAPYLHSLLDYQLSQAPECTLPDDSQEHSYPPDDPISFGIALRI